MTKDILQELSKPFPESVVGLKVQTARGGKGLVVAYIDARAVLDRLDEVVGPGGWHDEYEVLADIVRRNGDREERLVEVKCRLTVSGVTKEDVGEGDSMKAAFSDALKRAAVKFGIGRYLYSLPKVVAELDDRGNIKDYEAVKRKLFGGGAQASEGQEAPSGGGSSGGGVTEPQLKKIHVLLKQLGITDREEALDYARAALDLPELQSAKDLTKAQASKLIEIMLKDLEMNKEAENVF